MDNLIPRGRERVDERKSKGLNGMGGDVCFTARSIMKAGSDDCR